MFKIPKQEYTTEFKELAVKRVQGGEGIAKMARELGLVGTDAAQLGQGREERRAQSTRDQGRHPRADGVRACAPSSPASG